MRVRGFRSGVGRLGADCAGGEETELFQRLTAGHPERQVRKKDAFRVLHSVPPVPRVSALRSAP